MLKRDPTERLTIEQVKAHPFFASIDWGQLERKEITPPYVPNIKGATDIRNIDTDFTDERPEETLQESSALQTVKVEQFTYGGENFLDR